MNANTVEGAKKTALYFIQLYPYAMATGDVRDLDALSVQGKGKANCETCANYHAAALQMKKNHQTYLGGAITAKVTEEYLRDTLLDAYPFDILVSQDSATIRQPDGSIAERVEAAQVNLRVEVLHVKSGWKVLTIAHHRSDS